MMSMRPAQQRKWAVVAIVVAWSVLGMALPFLGTSVQTKDVGVRTAVVAAPADQFDLTDPIPLGLALGLTAHRGSLAILDGAGAVATGEKQSALLALGSGTLIADGLVVTTRPREHSGTPIAPLSDALAQGRFDTLRVKRGTFHIALSDDLTETLTNLDLEITNRRRAGMLLRGTAEIRGRKHSIDAQIGPDPERRTSTQTLKISIKGPLFSGSFEGQAGGSVVGQVSGMLDLTLPDLKTTANAIGLAILENSAQSEIRIRSAFEWTSSTLVLDRLMVQSPQSDAQGGVTISFAGSRPSISGTVATKAFDVANLVVASTSWLENHLPWTSLARSDHFFPLADQIDADIRLSANRLSIGGVQLEAAAVSTSLKAGKLIADFVEFDYAGGRGTGKLAADFTRGKSTLTWRGRLENADAARLSTLALGAPAVAGTMSVSVDLHSEGNRLSHIRKSITGRATVTMKDGGRFGFDLRNTPGAIGRGPVYGWDALPRGSTPIDQLDTRVTLRAGTMTFDQFAARSGSTVLTIAGSVNTSESRIDVDAGLSGVQAARPPGAVSTIPAELVGPREEIEIRGPLASPLIRRSTAATRAASPRDAASGDRAPREDRAAPR